MTIFYKIRSPQGAAADLFGTHHSPIFGNSSQLSSEFSLEITEAFRNAQYCMFEADVKFNAFATEAAGKRINHIINKINEL